MTKDEKIKKLDSLRAKAVEVKKDVEYYNALQLALKLVLNGESPQLVKVYWGKRGSYGALATPYFLLFNNNVAASITSHGREVIQLTESKINDYFYNQWHLDVELHEKMNLKNVTKIPNTTPCVIYSDTDSVISSTILDINDEKITIEDWYNRNIINGSAGKTINGHESVITNDKILNYNDNKGLDYSKVVRIIRHKVTKPKWKLKTKSGKEIIITNDHSLIVFRDNKKIEVKPRDVLKTDKILIVKR